MVKMLKDGNYPRMKTENKVYVKSFSSAKVKCMKDYVKFPLEKIIPTM